MQPMTLRSVDLAGTARAAQADDLAGVSTSSETPRSASTRGVAFAEMLADVVELDQRRLGLGWRCMPSASQRRGRIDLEREPHAEAAGQQADDEHDDAEGEPRPPARARRGAGK